MIKVREIFGTMDLVIKLLPSSPFVDQVGNGDRQGDKEATSNDEEQLRHESPKIDLQDVHSEREFDLSDSS